MNWKAYLVRQLNRITVNASVLGLPKIDQVDSLVRIGTDYGGWWIPAHNLSNNNGQRVLVSVGLGHDVTFDKGLLQNGFKLIGLDPLIECIKYAQAELADFREVNLINKGLWVETGKKVFFSPKVKEHDSFSITNSHKTDIGDSKVFEVLDISELFSNYPELMDKDTFVYFKMDIEGAELAILDKISKSDFQIDFLAAEIDTLSLISFLDLRKRIIRIIKFRSVLKQLNQLGYRLVHKENYNFFWERKTFFQNQI